MERSKKDQNKEFKDKISKTRGQRQGDERSKTRRQEIPDKGK